MLAAVAGDGWGALAGEEESRRATLESWMEVKERC
jgi:hypothetical protein